MSASERIAVFPGTFDPFTIGHFNIVERALPLFDKIIIAVGKNAKKDGFFDVEKRIDIIKQAFKDEPKIDIQTYTGLTVDFCNKLNAKYLLRGLRTSADFEYERAIAQMNKMQYPEIETVLLLTLPEHTPISSTIVRDIYRNGGDVSEYLPKGVRL